MVTSLQFIYPSFRGPPGHGLYLIYLCLLGLALGLAHSVSTDNLCLGLNEVKSGRINSEYLKDRQGALFSDPSLS